MARIASRSLAGNFNRDGIGRQFNAETGGFHERLPGRPEPEKKPLALDAAEPRQRDLFRGREELPCDIKRREPGPRALDIEPDLRFLGDGDREPSATV